MREDIWVDELNFKSYQNNEIDFIDDSGKSCCVHSLADYTKQVRKEVCEEIRDKMTHWEDCLTKEVTEYVNDKETLDKNEQGETK